MYFLKELPPRNWRSRWDFLKECFRLVLSQLGALGPLIPSRTGLVTVRYLLHILVSIRIFLCKYLTDRSRGEAAHAPNSSNTICLACHSVSLWGCAIVRVCIKRNRPVANPATHTHAHTHVTRPGFPLQSVRVDHRVFNPFKGSERLCFHESCGQKIPLKCRV